MVAILDYSHTSSTTPYKIHSQNNRKTTGARSLEFHDCVCVYIYVHRADEYSGLARAHIVKCKV